MQTTMSVERFGDIDVGISGVVIHELDALYSVCKESADTMCRKIKEICTKKVHIVNIHGNVLYTKHVHVDAITSNLDIYKQHLTLGYVRFPVDDERML